MDIILHKQGTPANVLIIMLENPGTSLQLSYKFHVLHAPVMEQL
jgi:hypothetical protein